MSPTEPAADRPGLPATPPAGADASTGDPIGTLGGFRPRTGSMDAWNAAYVRVEEYLRAHRIHNRLHQSRLIQTVLERAARRHEASPSLNPTALAAEEVDALMQRWFGAVLGSVHQEDEAGERTAAEGRLALLLCDGPEKWPYAFLDERTISNDFVAAMRAGVIQAGPDMSVSSMVPRPIDLGPIPEAAGETFETIEKWPILRTLLLWVVFAACLAAIFKMTR
ncbi:MAG TPA: hypothetical protein VHE61_02715 [Opitutaceae bacterium]|nr:hypothetical protein [Opitutaceae bacterium]